MFIESHIRNLSYKIEVIDINFAPNSTKVIDEIQSMHDYQEQELKKIMGFENINIQKAQ